MDGSNLRLKKRPIYQKVSAPTGATGHVPKSRQSRLEPEATIQSDLPAKLSPTKAEIALWRAFLADEIEAILRDGE